MKVVLLAHVAPDATAAPVGLAHTLHGPTSATTLPRRGTELLLTDGPFAESDEPVVGLEEIDVDGFDAGLDRAAGLPAARTGAVEVRGVHEGPDDGVPPATPSAGTRRYVFLHVLPTRPPAEPVAPGAGSLPDWLASPLTQRTVLAGNRLLDATAATAAVVRVRNGEVLVSPGLPDDREEEIAGYDLVAAHDLDEAIAVARPHPTLTTGVVEIRPLVMA
jgi:hypothetical protein